MPGSEYRDPVLRCKLLAKSSELRLLLKGLLVLGGNVDDFVRCTYQTFGVAAAVAREELVWLGPPSELPEMILSN